MKKYKLNFNNLENYSYIILTIIIILGLIYSYGFFKKNVFDVITNRTVILDATTIRISDVNLKQFEEVSKNINNKAISKTINSRNVFR